jgi:TPP-dependent indolepyruvate ferredoxin oxidoreductase alpha subunit
MVGVKKKIHGPSPRANYTDRSTAACRQSDYQPFADIGCHVVSVTDPYGCILDF